jgi:GNAT superfamily N-acetyltransferase
MGDSKAFLHLVDELAKFEKLDPPTPSGKKRLLRDTFVKKRLNLLLAFVNSEAAGYALYFFTYSSFLAMPTLYLEDLFVLQKFRGSGIGSKLLFRLVREAKKLDCGRMEWAVLAWNRRAINFYEKLGAKRLKEWYVYRLDKDKIDSLAKQS